jgi:hypothetical protein
MLETCVSTLVQYPFDVACSMSWSTGWYSSKCVKIRFRQLAV